MADTRVLSRWASLVVKIDPEISKPSTPPPPTKPYAPSPKLKSLSRKCSSKDSAQKAYNLAAPSPTLTPLHFLVGFL